MSKESYNDWKNRLSLLEKEVKCDPRNVELADSLWAGMKGPECFDLRSGDRLVSIYRTACLHSELGIVSFAKGYKELLRDTGEGPSKDNIDSELLISIENALKKLKGKNLEIVKWLYDAII